jgi:hypothetical protein
MVSEFPSLHYHIKKSKTVVIAIYYCAPICLPSPAKLPENDNHVQCERHSVATISILQFLSTIIIRIY